MSKIIVFDFDKTLIPIHLHNKLAQAIIAAKQKGQQLKYQNFISVLRKNLLKDFDNFILQ
ncbi:hypothetical protein B1F79_01420 [Coxiella-like endosymbiont of Rhipicephalus sanguineus]|nr:hypothetical protein [Coxiella-like endosymbiont of Rhipicephalus sanguineus]